MGQAQRRLSPTKSDEGFKLPVSYFLWSSSGIVAEDALDREAVEGMRSAATRMAQCNLEAWIIRTWMSQAFFA